MDLVTAILIVIPANSQQRNCFTGTEATQPPFFSRHEFGIEFVLYFPLVFPPSSLVALNVSIRSKSKHTITWICGKATGWLTTRLAKGCAPSVVPFLFPGGRTWGSRGLSPGFMAWPSIKVYFHAIMWSRFSITLVFLIVFLLHCILFLNKHIIRTLRTE